MAKWSPEARARLKQRYRERMQTPEGRAAWAAISERRWEGHCKLPPRGTRERRAHDTALAYVSHKRRRSLLPRTPKPPPLPASKTPAGRLYYKLRRELGAAAARQELGL